MPRTNVEKNIEQDVAETCRLSDMSKKEKHQVQRSNLNPIHAKLLRQSEMGAWDARAR